MSTIEYLLIEEGGDKMALWAIWLIIAGVLLIIEMMTLTFYLLWLSIGALVAALLDVLLPGALFVQVLAGSVVVIILTIFTKPITRSFHKSRGFQDAVDELIGKQGVVMEESAMGDPCIVKVGNETWSAVSNDPLKKGETVVVVSRGSAVLQVEKRGGD